VVAKSCIILNDKGTFRSGIPNEGSFIWKLGWQITTGLEFKLKYGLNYETLMKYEHVNNATEIGTILKYFYSRNKCSYFGFNKKFSLYKFYESSRPNIKLAENYLKNFSNK